MVALLGYVSSLVAMVSSALGFLALFAFTLLAAPVGAILFLFYAARSVFDETDVRELQHGPPTPA